MDSPAMSFPSGSECLAIMRELRILNMMLIVFCAGFTVS
jgi:hypothetical protein